MATDPVCGMEVDEHETNHTHKYKGITYYFCPRGCRRQFMRTPEKYLDRDNRPKHRAFHR